MMATMSILIIDDNEDDRYVYKRALQKKEPSGWRILERDNGEDGIACIASEMPDCVLLDYSLPGRNGVEVLKRIRTRFPFLPVLILTGQGNEAVAVAAIQEGAQYYITKSQITPENLTRSIRLAVENGVMRERIEDQRVSLELFTRALAHDLKEPVRTIRSFLDIITQQKIPPEQSERYINFIHQAAERMGQLVDTVYHYMRLDNPDANIKRETCDAQNAFNGAVENLATLIEESEAIVTADTLPMVHANSIQCLQVLQNLISNAINHCGPKPVIHVSADRHDTMWVFKVVDNGSGIPEEFAEKIFEPFKRLSSTGSKGLGLGLAICKKIIESHGGTVQCAPHQPQGSCFLFSLPAISDNSKETPQVANMNKPCIHAGEEMANILLVDDNKADIELMRYEIGEERKISCNITIANSGASALNQCAQPAIGNNRVDLVVLDINMPGMDGFEFLKNFRQNADNNSIPVVMCSTSTYDKDIWQAKQLGACGYMTKPFRFVELESIIKDLPYISLRQSTQGLTLMRHGDQTKCPVFSAH